MGGSARTQPDPTLLEFGQLMRARRQAKALTQREMAAKIGVSQQSVDYYERGLVGPSLSKALLWCELLDLDMWPAPRGEA